jgi:asparagine synthase (glutamine-hydrolysing)
VVVVGNFFVILSPKQAQAQAEGLFRLGLERAEQLKAQAPKNIIDVVFARAATFARHNGSGGNIATDTPTGCWLLAAGTWFHSDGYASGDEDLLLKRMMGAGAARVAQELEGFFVIVFCDSVMRELFVVTDVMGSRHCFTRTIGGVTALSTSSLLLAGLGDATPDAVGCEEFLRSGVIYEDRTLFREVKKLAPATVFRFAAGKPADSRSYWRIADLDPDALDGEKAVEKLSGELVGAAKRVCALYSNPVCDLTGGYDSRSIVAAFLSAEVQFETTVAGAPDHPDVIASKSLSSLVGVHNWHFEPETEVSFEQLTQALPLTDGECDLVEYARIHSLHSQLSSLFDVSVNGSYGELARGYWWELLFPKAGKREPVDPYRLAAKRYAVETDSPLLFPPGVGLEMVEHFAVIVNRVNRGLAEWPNTTQMDHAYLMMRMQRWQGRIASSTDQIWPCISPYLFRSVLNAALQTSVRTRKNNKLMRQLITKLQPRLAAYPLEQGAMPLGLETLPRFVPALWQKGWSKAGEKLLNRSSSSAGPESLRFQLWRDEQVQELLEPAGMRLNRLIDSSRLRDFLNSSRQPHFAYDQQWRRVLSLEMALRFLHGEIDLVRESGIDLVRESGIDLVQESEIDLIRESEIDLIRESEINGDRGGEIDLVREGEIDLVRESEINGDRGGEIDLIREGEIDLVREGEIDLIRESEINGDRGGEIDLVREGEIDLVRESEIDGDREKEL